MDVREPGCHFPPPPLRPQNHAQINRGSTDNSKKARSVSSTICYSFKSLNPHSWVLLEKLVLSQKPRIPRFSCDPRFPPLITVLANLVLFTPSYPFSLWRRLLAFQMPFKLLSLPYYNLSFLACHSEVPFNDCLLCSVNIKYKYVTKNDAEQERLLSSFIHHDSVSSNSIWETTLFERQPKAATL